MAKLYHPGGQELFQSLGKIIDFYYYKGQLCARSMPQHCNQPGTPAQQVTWEAMRTRGDQLHYLTKLLIDSYKRMALGSDKTWVDIFTTNWLNCYNRYGAVKPIVYDYRAFSTIFGTTLWVMTTGKCYVMEHFYYGLPEKRPWLWRWETQQDYDPPPNCRKKVRLRQTWPSVRWVKVDAAHKWAKFAVYPRISSYGRWFTLTSQWHPLGNPFVQSGVIHFGQGY